MDGMAVLQALVRQLTAAAAAGAFNAGAGGCAGAGVTHDVVGRLPAAIDRVIALCQAARESSVAAVHANWPLLTRVLQRHGERMDVFTSVVTLLAASRWYDGANALTSGAVTWRWDREVQDLCDAVSASSIRFDNERQRLQAELVWRLLCFVCSPQCV